MESTAAASSAFPPIAEAYPAGDGADDLKAAPKRFKVPRWTPDEDEMLRQLVLKHGDRAWKQIAAYSHSC